MTVDEILADTNAAIDLPDGSCPVHIFVVVDYINPGTGRRDLAVIADDDLPYWCAPSTVHAGLELLYGKDDDEPT